jgi:hypothetical protein
MLPSHAQPRWPVPGPPQLAAGSSIKKTTAVHQASRLLPPACFLDFIACRFVCKGKQFMEDKEAK